MSVMPAPITSVQLWQAQSCQFDASSNYASWNTTAQVCHGNYVSSNNASANYARSKNASSIMAYHARSNNASSYNLSVHSKLAQSSSKIFLFGIVWHTEELEDPKLDYGCQDREEFWFASRNSTPIFLKNCILSQSNWKLSKCNQFFHQRCKSTHKVDRFVLGTTFWIALLSKQ